MRTEILALRKRVSDLESQNQRQAEEVSEEAEQSGRLLARLAELEGELAKTKSQLANLAVGTRPTVAISAQSDLSASISSSGMRTTSSLRQGVPGLELIARQALAMLAEIERSDDRTLDTRNRAIAVLRRIFQQLASPAFERRTSAPEIEFDDAATPVPNGSKR